MIVDNDYVLKIILVDIQFYYESKASLVRKVRMAFGDCPFSDGMMLMRSLVEMMF